MLGEKVNSFMFYQYGGGEFLLCGSASWFSKDKLFLLTTAVVQIRVNWRRPLA